MFVRTISFQHSQHNTSSKSVLLVLHQDSVCKSRELRCLRSDHRSKLAPFPPFIFSSHLSAFPIFEYSQAFIQPVRVSKDPTLPQVPSPTISLPKLLPFLAHRIHISELGPRLGFPYPEPRRSPHAMVTSPRKLFAPRLALGAWLSKPNMSTRVNKRNQATWGRRPGTPDKQMSPMTSLVPFGVRYETWVSNCQPNNGGGVKVERTREGMYI